MIEHEDFSSEASSQKPNPYHDARSTYSQTLLILYVVAWPAVILTAPLFWLYSPLAGILYALTIGLHVNTQLGLFYHESWHNGFFKKPRHNRSFFWIISFYLISSPQFYGIAHATHHKDIHTFNDLEFWPAKEHRSKLRARIALIFELFLGIIAWQVRVAPAIYKHKNYSSRTSILFIAGWIVMCSGLLYLSRLFYGDSYWYAFLAYGLHLWLFAVALRLLQFLEHLGITAPDLDYTTRVHLTRNTQRQGLLNQLWHKITLNETAEHTLHHQRAGIPYRRYMPLPPPAPSTPVRPVSVIDLPRIIWQYWKNPLREIGANSADLDEIPALDAKAS
ncbi:MAG: fatty acid desaturase [Verrucomicrobiales bacterium]|nr:fatty acid desaturase [Verrucomicrobiales bacterium]